MSYSSRPTAQNGPKHNHNRAANAPPSQANGQRGEQAEIVIAIMGTTGAGKSKFIRALTGDQSIIEGHSLQSCTQQIATYETMYNRQHIVFVDTPGFNDTNRKDTVILQEVAQWLSITYSNNKLLSGIIYLHRITDNRMEGTALRNLRMFQSLCGDKVLSNVMLTTTHWDVVDQTRAVERETELQSTFWKGMTERGAKVKRCDGSRDSAWKVVEPLLSLDRIVLNIQKQIELGMTVSDTDAGQVVNEELLNARKKFEEELDALKTEWKAASDEKDVEMARILEEERKHAEGKLQQVKAEQEEFMRVQIEEMKRKNEELQRKIDEAHSSGGWFPRLAKAFVGGLATLVGVPAPLAIGLASAI